MRAITGLVTALQSRGIFVTLEPNGIGLNYNKLPDQAILRSLVYQRPPECDTEIVYECCMGDVKRRAPKSIRFTMWESTKTNQDFINRINQFDALCVPCAWNAKNFRADGVKIPIHKIPLGIDPVRFHWLPQNLSSGRFVFGTLGRMGVFQLRKNFIKAADWFIKAFPRETDVELWIKGFPDDKGLPDAHPFDSRIKIIKNPLSDEDYVKLIGQLNVVVNTAWAEGWGLCQSEALACGRPVIMPNYSGMAEFFSRDTCYEVGYTEVEPPQHEYLHYHGKVCKMNEDDIVDAMRYAYSNPSDVVQRGLVSSRRMLQFTWERSAIKFEQLLHKLGAI